MRSQKIKLDGSGCEAAGEKARRNKCWKGSESWRFETVDVEKWIRVGGKVECWKVIERWRKRWMLNKKLKGMLTAEKMNESWRKRWWLKSEKKLKKSMNVEEWIKLEKTLNNEKRIGESWGKRWMLKN